MIDFQKTTYTRELLPADQAMTDLQEILSERPATSEKVPELTPELMQGLEKRRIRYNEAKKSGGFWGFLKSVFGGIGNFIKGIVNPKNWIDPAFWRDAVAPVATAFIPAIGPILATVSKWGTAAYEGVRGIIDLAHGKFQDGLASIAEAFKGVGWLPAGKKALQK